MSGLTSGETGAVKKSRSRSKKQPEDQVYVNTPTDDKEMGCQKTTEVVESAPSTPCKGNTQMSTLISFSEDLSTAEAPAPLPIGQYPAEIVKAEPKTSASGESNYLAIQFRIHADSYPADFTEGNPDGTVLPFNRTPIDDSPRGRYLMRKFLTAVGAKTAKEIDVLDLVGLVATVDVRHKEWEGELRAEIAKVISAE